MRNKVRPKRLTVNTKYADANAVGYTECSIRITNSYTDGNVLQVFLELDTPDDQGHKTYHFMLRNSP